MDADQPSDKPDQVRTYRCSVVIERLNGAGFEAYKDSVKRASDKFLGLDTLSRGPHRRWTDDEIDQLILAYRLRHHCDIGWPRIAEMFHDDTPLEEHVQREMAATQDEIDDLWRRRRGFESLSRDLARDAETETTAA